MPVAHLYGASSPVPVLITSPMIPGDLIKYPTVQGTALLAPELTFELDGRTFMAGQQDRLFRNDGYATFVDVTNESGLEDHGNGLSVVWWDFDDDGLIAGPAASRFSPSDPESYEDVLLGLMRRQEMCLSLIHI